MFELKNGMILELCNSDFGVFYNRNVICQSYGFNIDNVGLDNLFGKSRTNKESVQTVYRNKCIFIDGMFDHSRYHESSVLWSRNDCIYEGDAFTCMNANAADKYHVEVDKTYIKTKNGIEEVSEGIIPYLRVEIKKIK